MTLEDARVLCRQYWNPLGVPMRASGQNWNHPEDLPEDEYDVYLLHAIHLIAQGNHQKELVAYLTRVETEFLMLDDPAGDKLLFVESLFDAYGRSSA